MYQWHSIRSITFIINAILPPSALVLHTVSLFTCKVSFSSYLKLFIYWPRCLVTFSTSHCHELFVSFYHIISLAVFKKIFPSPFIPPISSYTSTLQSPDCCPTPLQNISKGRKLFSLPIILHRNFQTNNTIFIGTLYVHGISQAFCLVYDYFFLIRLLCILHWSISV